MQWNKNDELENEFEDEFEDELEDEAEDEVIFRYENKKITEIDEDAYYNTGAPQYYQTSTEIHVPDSFTVRVKDELDCRGEEPIFKRSVTIEQY